MTAAWSYLLLERSAEFLPWLAPVVLAGGLAVALGLLPVRSAPRRTAAAQEIAGWVEQNFTVTTVGGATVNDLTG